MVQVTTQEESEIKEKPFPKLMIDDYGTIIYAEKINEDLIHGTDLSDGQFIDHWIASKFKDYNGTVTLKNE